MSQFPGKTEWANLIQKIPELVTSIKEAAQLTGLTEDTIRYYERKLDCCPMLTGRKTGIGCIAGNKSIAFSF
ncbi:MerR family DNA-binding transcriptional regulator [Bacillus sp. FJAT-27264]|uniref:MerR family DNA-binding transcriptional regulator n=1 Tax=Paenibacillus sp. (strain DSM 101736 / FJAT-27264) TaxID=1850362 RepID=UPI0009F6460D|nr:MerR family DNA-binding transcriptional regulator [Bacillus sp. FJAT-27264]